jgi:hypothetical protein
VKGPGEGCTHHPGVEKSDGLGGRHVDDGMSALGRQVFHPQWQWFRILEKDYLLESGVLVPMCNGVRLLVARRRLQSLHWLILVTSNPVDDSVTLKATEETNLRLSPGREELLGNC